MLLSKKALNKKNFNIYSTNDRVIRAALRDFLIEDLKKYRSETHKPEIFEELGIQHGSTRIDFAVINGSMSGYEIKSDRDTLNRLSEQIKEFSEVFDKLTLVVGKKYLYQAIHKIPEWWGVWLAKEDGQGEIALQVIREPQQNQQQNVKSIARLLWREEALKILSEHNEATGLRYKTRELIYSRLENVFSADISTLKERVNIILTSREGWRSDQSLA